MAIGARHCGLWARGQLGAGVVSLHEGSAGHWGSGSQRGRYTGIKHIQGGEACDGSQKTGYGQSWGQKVSPDVWCVLLVCPGLSLLLQSSPNVERDVGLQQAASGLGFIVRNTMHISIYELYADRYRSLTCIDIVIRRYREG